MRAVIVQGQGFYGFNLRLVSDQKAEEIIRVAQARHRGDPSKLNADTVAIYPDGSARWVETLLGQEFDVQVIADPQVGENKSWGFGTGLWGEGENLMQYLDVPIISIMEWMDPDGTRKQSY
jgi:hypothetical protein